jgi:hypothetical protein
MKMKLPGLCAAAFLLVAVAACPATAASITYTFVDATASFAANSSAGATTSYTLNISGTFTANTAEPTASQTFTATSVDITLSSSDSLPPLIASVLREYTELFSGIVFSGNAFSAINDICCGPVAISLRFANPLGYSKNPLVDFLYESSAIGGPIYSISITGFADPLVCLDDRAALAQKYGGLADAANALGFPSVSALQDAIRACSR